MSAPVKELTLEIASWALKHGGDGAHERPGNWVGITEPIDDLGPLQVRVNPHPEKCGDLDRYVAICVCTPFPGATVTSPLPIKPSEAARTKFTVVADENGEWIWSRRPTPAQDEAWIARQHEWRDQSVSFAKSLSKLSVRHFGWAAETTNPDRAARYAAEGRRLRRKAREYLREARNRNV